MSKISEIPSPTRGARPAPAINTEAGLERKSSSMPATTLVLSGRTVTLRTKPEDSGPPPARRAPPLNPAHSSTGSHQKIPVSGAEASAQAAHAAKLAEARAGKAVVGASARSAPLVINTAEWRDMAAAGILKMKDEVGNSAGTANEGHAAMQTRIKRLQGMAELRNDALRFQAAMRDQIGGLEATTELEHHTAWNQALAVDLEAVFHMAEAVAQDLQAQLDHGIGTASKPEAKSNLESDAHTLESSATDAESDVPQAGSEPLPARSLDAERIFLGFNPSGAASDQENGLALKNKISRMEQLQESRGQFSPADGDRIDQALTDLRDRMTALKEHLSDKGIPESLFFRKPTPRHEIEASRERSRREAQEALESGNYTF